MPAVLSTILYILLFIVCLSTLIMIHEAGHLVAAKAFDVYCFEYSIGFGPKLFSKKRKNGETYFSLRAIPLGGYVSMYGEADVVPEGVGPIDEKRSLLHIKRWKRIIVLVAGVTMNAILALIIFFICESAFTQYSYSAAKVQVAEDSIAYNAGLRNDDLIYLSENGDYYFVIDEKAYIDETETKVAACLTRQLQSKDDISWKDHLFFVKYTNDELIIKEEYMVKPESIKDNHITIVIKTEKKNEETGEYVKDKEYPVTISIERNAEDFFYQDTGLGITKTSYHNNFGQALGKTFGDFGNASTAIFRGLAAIFTGGFNEVGGIIAVGVVTTNTLKDFGFASFLSLWAMISVNLAIVNLLPFPGLDGWQILVTIVEGVTRKEIPTKVKTIMSLIGIGLLFALMIALIIKDLIMFVF